MVEWSQGRAPIRGHSRRDVAGYSRLIGEGEAGALARLAGVAHAMCVVSDRLVAYLGHICIDGVIEVTAVPLSAPALASRARGRDLRR